VKRSKNNNRSKKRRGGNCEEQSCVFAIEGVFAVEYCTNLAYSKGIVQHSSGESVKHIKGRSPCPKIRRIAKKNRMSSTKSGKTKITGPLLTKLGLSIWGLYVLGVPRTPYFLVLPVLTGLIARIHNTKATVGARFGITPNSPRAQQG